MSLSIFNASTSVQKEINEMQNLSADLFLMDAINTAQKRRKHVTHLTMGKKTRKRLPIADDSQGTVEKICQVSPLKVETKLLQTTEIEKKNASFSMDTDTDIPSSQSSTQTEDDIHQEHINTLPTSFQVLIQNGTLNCLCNILSEYGQLKDFENLLRNITLGKIPLRNICWLVNLHLGRLTSLTSTTAMRWDEEIVEFFSIVYLLFGASAVNVLRGPMHFSEVVMENVERDKFDPRSAKINLPIPSIRTLHSLSTGYPKEIPVGLVDLTLSITQEGSKKGTQYILSFDGKMVARGLKGELFGNKDLWGIEKLISMKSSLQLLDRNTRACEYLNQDVNENKLFAQAYCLKSLLNEMSRRVHTLWQRIEGEHYLCLKLVRMSQNQALDSWQQYSYKMQLSFLNEHSACCNSHIGRALHLNMCIISMLAML